MVGRSYHKQWPCCGGEALNDGFPGRDGTRVFDMDFGRVAIMTCVRSCQTCATGQPLSAQT